MNIPSDTYCPDFKFYYVHIPKCMGTTIYKQLPKTYNDKYYSVYYTTYLKNKYPHLKTNLFTHTQILLDHIIIEDAIQLNLLHEKDLEHKEFIMIWRHPIDRLLSFINSNSFGNPYTPTVIIKILKKEISDGGIIIELGRNSIYMTASDFIKYKGIPIKTTNILFGDFITLNKVFSKYGITIHNTKENKTKNKKYTIKDFSKEQIEFLEDFYKEDFIVYNNLLKKYGHNISHT